MRDGSIQCLTRDHTMVNMFVDHDLLSPEDAASHPEAHVLARSLGVERQVDIEFQEPVRVMEGDVLILCSDGVHGVVSEEQLAALDWSSPEVGVQEVLKEVDKGNGTDNATLVVLCFGVSADKTMALTDPPAAERIDDHLTPSSQGPIRAPALLNEPQPPALFTVDPSQATPIPPPEARKTAMSNAANAANPVPELRDKAKKEATPQKPKRKRLMSLAVSLGLFLTMIGAAASVVLLIWYAKPLPAGPTKATKVTTNEPVPEEATAEKSKVDKVVKSRIEIEEEPEIVPEDTHWYAPTQRPQEGVRAGPRQYINPAPSGSHSKLVVEASRNGECATAMSKMSEALTNSSDYAILYKKIWRCYNVSHQKPLKAKLNSWKEMRPLIVHFQGNTATNRTKNDEESLASSDDVPAWARPAAGGIEQRLEAWSNSSLGDGLMHDVVRDHFSQQVVATNLANDLLIEVTAALALSRVQNPPDEVVQWWARRLYYSQMYWDSPVGHIVKEYQPAITSSFEQMLKTASNDIVEKWEESGMTYSVSGAEKTWQEFVQESGTPEVVGEAVLVAKGYLPPAQERAKLKAEDSRRRNGNRSGRRGTGAPTGEIDLSIMNEARALNSHQRVGDRD